MKALIVYYSRSGHTRTLAQKLGTVLEATLDEIVPLANHSGLLGYMRSALESRFEHRAVIAPPMHDPDRFDLVVIGTPVWAESVASPVRAYLKMHAATLRRVAFFCTMAEKGSDRTFVQMQQTCVRPPLAALALTERELANIGIDPRVDDAINAFIARLGTQRSYPLRDPFGFFGNPSVC